LLDFAEGVAREGSDVGITFFGKNNLQAGL